MLNSLKSFLRKVCFPEVKDFGVILTKKEAEQLKVVIEDYLGLGQKGYYQFLRKKAGKTFEITNEGQFCLVLKFLDGKDGKNRLNDYYESMRFSSTMKETMEEELSYNLSRRSTEKFFAEKMMQALKDRSEEMNEQDLERLELLEKKIGSKSETLISEIESNLMNFILELEKKGEIYKLFMKELNQEQANQKNIKQYNNLYSILDKI